MHTLKERKYINGGEASKATLFRALLQNQEMRNFINLLRKKKRV
jgi:hypothetical protein